MPAVTDAPLHIEALDSDPLEGWDHDPRRDARPRQLSLLAAGAEPDSADLKIAGPLPLSRELNKGEFLIVEVKRGDEIIAQAEAVVTMVTFKDKRSEGAILATERNHTAQVTFAARQPEEAPEEGGEEARRAPPIRMYKRFMTHKLQAQRLADAGRPGGERGSSVLLPAAKDDQACAPRPAALAPGASSLNHDERNEAI